MSFVYAARLSVSAPRVDDRARQRQPPPRRRRFRPASRACRSRDDHDREASRARPRTPPRGRGGSVTRSSAVPRSAHAPATPRDRDAARITLAAEQVPPPHHADDLHRGRAIGQYSHQHREARVDRREVPRLPAGRNPARRDRDEQHDHAERHRVVARQRSPDRRHERRRDQRDSTATGTRTAPPGNARGAPAPAPACQSMKRDDVSAIQTYLVSTHPTRAAHGTAHAATSASAEEQPDEMPRR